MLEGRVNTSQPVSAVSNVSDSQTPLNFTPPRAHAPFSIPAKTWFKGGKFNRVGESLTPLTTLTGQPVAFRSAVQTIERATSWGNFGAPGITLGITRRSGKRLPSLLRLAVRLPADVKILGVRVLHARPLPRHGPELVDEVIVEAPPPLTAVAERAGLAIVDTGAAAAPHVLE
jgi:hypothetical protein